MKTVRSYPISLTHKNISKSKGFTLVELLIVVAIIGILSTIGIPTFKRMVQKAKKSEAKVGLGGLYTAEAAFFAEYGAYGSNLDKLGFELEGSLTNRIYSVGFPEGALCVTVGVHKPLVALPVGIAINAAFPDFYDIPTAADDRKVVMRPTHLNCQDGVMADDGSSYTASATGIIAPGLQLDAALADQDIWTIDDTRQLSNVQDGMQ